MFASMCSSDMTFRRIGFSALSTCFVAFAASGPFQFSFDQKQSQWSLSNGVIHAEFQLTPHGIFQVNEINHLQNGVSWKAAPQDASSPISINLDGTVYDSKTHFKLISQRVVTPSAMEAQQIIVLQDFQGKVRIRLELDMYAGQPVLRHRVSVTNLEQSVVYAQAADLAPYSFSADAETFQLRRVAQWTVAPTPENFQTTVLTMNPDGTPVKWVTGSQGAYCTWGAVSDENGRGLFVGWEFDGQAQGSARQVANESVQLSAKVLSLHHPLPPGSTFDLPAAFVGVYQGDWDEAGFRTQQFAESVLATPAPPGFPYMSWDSWGYTTNINQQTLRANAKIAADLGVELFIIDLGWARQIGDWREDPKKFPGGLRALSDYVHSLGMKFGLHFALAEVMAGAPVLEANPDWISSVSSGYHGALSLCLSNRPTQQWIIQQALHMIDNYNVDWILQDGASMVKQCTKTTHTHDPQDSNYSNAVDGIDAVVSAVRRLRPGVLWENCEDGGSMMTFSMIQRYVTSITNDASGALGARQGAYGATYPFSPRFADRYMPEDPSTSYFTRSYMFGGPWHLMNQLPAMTSGAKAFAAGEIAVYKNIRDHIRSGAVYHLTGEPGVNRTDAIESYLPSSDSAITVVARNNTAQAFADIKLHGLKADKTYQVSFETDRRILAMTGQQILDTGVRVNLPDPQSAEIVYVNPLN
jgi:alpha-galactosidase